MSIYQTFYDLINNYIFNNLLIPGSYQELVTILFSTTACFAMVAIPFVLVWNVIKIFTRW